jgi:predicted amidohydrolase
MLVLFCPLFSVEAAEKCMDIFNHKVVRVAAVQFPVRGGLKREDFYKKVDAYLQQAHKEKTKLVVLPELITADVITVTAQKTEGAAMRELGKEFFISYREWLIERANHYQMAIMGGTTPRESGGKIFNTSVLVFPGQKVFLQDKLFLTPIEKEWKFSVGDRLQVFDTPLGKIAILICFDCEMPQLSQLLAPQRPEIILVPSWTSSMQGFHRVSWTAQARAIEHYAYVIKTSTVAAKGATDVHFGQAAIIQPQDLAYSTQIKQGTFNKPDIIFGEIQREMLDEQRQKTGYYPAKEQDLLKKTRTIKINPQ